MQSPKRANRGIRAGAIIVTVVLVFAGIQALRKYRDINSDPPRPPAVCFPEPSTPPDRALEGDFEIIVRVKRLPDNIKPAFKERNGKRWAIANPGEQFEAFDFITDMSLPPRRLIFAGRSPEITFVHYEQGGYGLGYEVAAFRTPTSKLDPLWRRHCPRPANNLNDLRTMIAAGQCPTEAEWHKGFTCTNGLEVN